jgi:hypothetical protein
VGLAALLRPVFLATGVFIGLALILLARTWRSRLRTAGVFALCCAVVLLPWVVRNEWQFGRPIVTTTHGGYTFRLGNHPAFYHYLRTAPWGATWKARDEIGQDGRRLVAQKLGPASRAEREMAIDRYHYRRGVQAIADQPTMFAWASLVRMGRLWQLVPHCAGPGETQAARYARYTVGVWYLLETVLTVVGLVVLGRRLRYPPWLWAIVFCASFTLVHTVYWSNMRMRAPLIPVVALLAAAGLTQCQCASIRTLRKSSHAGAQVDEDGGVA